MPPDRGDDLRRALGAGVESEGVLRRLQRGELAFDHAGLHEVPGALGDPGGNRGRVSAQVDQHDLARASLAYPGYGLLNLSAGYSWKRGPRQFHVGLNLRNALDRDLLLTNARVGAGRELGFTARVNY